MNTAPVSGQNRFLQSRGLLSPLGSSGTPVHAVQGTCVFISHKREDGDAAIAAADTLQKVGVDVWLDVNELDAKSPTTVEEHRKPTEAIETGLRNSSHLLALITPRTQASWWVPYEIGTSRALGRQLAFFLHKNVSLSSYMYLGDWIDDQETFYTWAEKLSRTPELAANWRRLERLSTSALDRFLPKHKGPSSFSVESNNHNG